MSDNKLWFAHFAQWASRFTGRPVTFMLAVASIAVWALTGPLFGLQRYLAARDQHRANPCGESAGEARRCQIAEEQAKR